MFYKSLRYNLFVCFAHANRRWTKAVQGDEIDPSASSNDTDELQEDPEQQLRIDYLIEKMLISKLAVENASNLYKMGHKFNDLVFDCNFRGTDCR